MSYWLSGGELVVDSLGEQQWGCPYGVLSGKECRFVISGSKRSGLLGQSSTRCPVMEEE